MDQTLAVRETGSGSLTTLASQKEDAIFGVGWTPFVRAGPPVRLTGSGLNPMARNFKELQAKMDPASRSDNLQRVRAELQRMALDKLRNAKPTKKSES